MARLAGSARGARPRVVGRARPGRRGRLTKPGRGAGQVPHALALRCAPDSAAPCRAPPLLRRRRLQHRHQRRPRLKARSDDAAARPRRGRRAQGGRVGTIAVFPSALKAAAHARHAPATPPPSTPGPPRRQAQVATCDRHPAAADRSAAQTCSRAAALARVLPGRAALAAAVPDLATNSAAPAAVSGHPDARSSAPS